MLIRSLSFALVSVFVAANVQAEIVAKTYPVKDFSEFVSGGNTSVEITQDGTEYLRVEAEAEVMKRIKVDQTGKRVSVWAKGEPGFFNWFNHSNEPVRIVLRVKKLEYLEISGGARANVGDLQSDIFRLGVSGAGNVEFAGLNAGELIVDLSGAANVKLNALNSKRQDFDLSGASNVDIRAEGNTQSLEVTASGASNFRGRKLTAKDANLGASGASHVEASVTDVLTAEASGASSIDYYGDPKAKTNSSGASHVNAH
ncbi:head GIN domain-containing protein [Cellvibrio sp. pealriver]|uniref:head GIN domain-containing protein n=1 Tax=Cellvibrio sp. pealriver TaxID=1622269 RepID=UPI00066FD85B|nr:head GIN domain-containing protein [Cellvibrio sp. pealriver]